MKFHEYKGLDLVAVGNEILGLWKKNGTFEKSLESREGAPEFVFFEGPPSANGMPGIHHVMARSIKDAVCRYKTQSGFKVERRAGWDTHGLPVELGVEKMLGITKEDIGTKISVEEYNRACRREVMKYTKEWVSLTERIGYWVDTEDAYITYDNRYIETLWYLLKDIYGKGLLYKGFSIQPFSPAAGTGLSTHELNQPGCYREVKDTTATVQFEVIKDERSQVLFDCGTLPVYFLAWTTTPWTLPSNTALCVGPDIDYVRVLSFNPYSGAQAVYVVAKALVGALFNPKAEGIPMADYKIGDKLVPFKVFKGEFKGSELVGIHYKQLIPWFRPDEGAFRVIPGDYVTTEDGTGIVHIAPTFGADDNKVAKAAGVPPLMVVDRGGERQAQVDRKGRFFRLEDLDPSYLAERVAPEYAAFAGRYVKNAYDDSLPADAPTLDVDLCVMLKQQGKAFRIEKHTHSYPHCWRTDKPVIYYPLDSWFIRTTAVRDEMIALNNEVEWKPESTGSGRFGKWLENIQDWNLSRSRFWGTPLPVWRTEDGKEEKCVGSVSELYGEIEKAVEAGVMSGNPLREAGFTPGDMSKENYDRIDLHRPYVDRIFLVSDSGRKMVRESDLIDVWFDSGSMPYAQEGLRGLDSGRFGRTADFIAEGVDQTRGWFYTLHAIHTMVSGTRAYKRVISNGLVLDKNGEKMSKRLGNAVDPFKALDDFGPDALRWYMLTNAQPWDNLKFDEAGVDEVRRKFFGTLYNTYSFFALYANVDGVGPEALAAGLACGKAGAEASGKIGIEVCGKVGTEVCGEVGIEASGRVPVGERQEIDRWLVSLLNTLVRDVVAAYENYDITTAGRLIQDFVCDHLSNWYVRLNRKRFWGGSLDRDKLAAYQTLYEALVDVALLSAPIAPFYAERLYLDLVPGAESVHLQAMPVCDESLIDKDLEERMDLAQRASSMVLALRRKVNIKVRQPLSKLVIPVLDGRVKEQLEKVRRLLLTEVNVKEAEFITDTVGLITKKIRPNFKVLGKKYGARMKAIAAYLGAMSQEEIGAVEAAEACGRAYEFALEGGPVTLEKGDYEIHSEDMPGWLVASDGPLTVALDVELTPELVREGTARELVNRIQNLRKDRGFDVTDRVEVVIFADEGQRREIGEALGQFGDYVRRQTLAREIRVEAGEAGVEVGVEASVEAGDGSGVEACGRASVEASGSAMAEGSEVEWGDGSIRILVRRL